MKHRDKIIELRNQGKSYSEIQATLGCSKGTISFHLGTGQKQKSYNRSIKNHPYLKKIYTFTTETKDKIRRNIKIRKAQLEIKVKIKEFCMEEGRNYGDINFTVEDVVAKFGENPTCYLTGEKIDIYKPRTYHFDHIQPRAKGGDNSIDNLGICTRNANFSKSDMTVEEFLNHCKKVLEHNGFNVQKKE